MMAAVGVVWLVQPACGQREGAGVPRSAPAGSAVAEVPEPAREFRGAWVATVANIDWPSEPGLPAASQRAEADAIVRGARERGLNALVLQVRPACDALYRSSIEPWSEFLTGESGKAPDDGYDPLEYWIALCRANGLQLHAWVNPFRARHFQSKKPDAPSHISKARPDLVKTYGEFLWLDPGEKDAQDHAVRVILDIVRRYDIDGVHIDDYFYPYPKAGVAFPDDDSYRRYRLGGGELARGDWRRSNIDGFVERLYRETKAAKPHVKVGVSPFGIWRPDHPAGVKGMDAYEQIFADAKLWLERGWMDYCAPQLYWRVDAPQQPFGPLLDWWVSRNLKGRHVWPGLYASRVLPNEKQRWEPAEVVRQIEERRKRAGSTGEIHFSIKALVGREGGGMGGALSTGPYAGFALPPATPWLRAPALPRVEVEPGRTSRAVLTPAPGAEGQRLVVSSRVGGEWSHRVVWTREAAVVIDAAAGASEVAVRAFGRTGELGPAARAGLGGAR